LDFLSEVVPEEALLSDLESYTQIQRSLKSRLSEGELARSESSADEENDSREAMVIKGLKEECLRMSRPTPIPRRRSISPERRPQSKPRRNYRHLPVSEDGKIEYPVILGRGVYRTILLNAGEVEDGINFPKDTYIYPVGFHSKRKYFTFDTESTLDRPKKVFYHCLIKKIDQGPFVWPLSFT
jgi:hypothetical protein